MQALYTALVVRVVAAHFAFLAYLPVGGFLARCWRRSIVVHVAAVCWAVGSIALHFYCPLTALERWARLRAGLPPLAPGGFVDHYIVGSWYPPAATGWAQAVVFSAVAVSWLLYLRDIGHAPRLRHPNRIS